MIFLECGSFTADHKFQESGTRSFSGIAPGDPGGIMVGYKPERILVERSAWGDRTTEEILARLPGVAVETIPDVASRLPALKSSSDPRGSGKRTLILARNPGNFVKGCPGGGAEICCNYVVINYALNCHFECTYCVLQDFLNNPALTVFTNIDRLMDEVRQTVRRSRRRALRIGTGETSDSLALDDITHCSRRLVPFFAGLDRAVLELKTKSDRIDNLEGLDHRGRTIVSWSLNPRKIILSEELKTSTLEERLAAAARCRKWGYRIGFHFDPLIHYPGWEEDYRETVEEMFRAVPPPGIAWISLGCLRFTAHLRNIVRGRFPKSAVPYGEFVPGNHGKLRYFRSIRDEMYSKIRSWIARRAPEVFVYLCMENRAVWRRCFEDVPASSDALSARMDDLVLIRPETEKVGKGEAAGEADISRESIRGTGR